MPQPPDTLYLALRDQVEGLLTEGRLERRQAGEVEKVQTYWHIGDALTRHFLDHPDQAYGEQTVRRLGQDLQLAASTLYEILRFRRLQPRVAPRPQLTWTHYRALIHLPDPDLFAHYEALTAANAWSTRQLKQAVEADHPGLDLGAAAAGDKPLRARFGQLSTYRVIPDPLDPEGPHPAIDLGFHQPWVPQDLPGFARARPGDLVTLQTRAGVVRARLRTDRPRLWTYVARRLHVVDGDTLDAVVDLGSGHRACPRLRLRGIDCPELYTRAGRAAKAFVQQALAAVDLAVITTWRTDSYGRYLADLTYRPGHDDPEAVLAGGTYLNRQLLDQGLAVRYDA